MTTTIEPTEKLAGAIRRQFALIERASGFSLRALDVETDGRARLEMSDGETVLTLDRDTLGRVSLTHERVVRYETSVGRSGDRQRVERLMHQFVERRHPTGWRSGMRLLGQHVAPTGYRTLFAPVLQLTGGAA
jgi:hypothetical protein